MRITRFIRSWRALWFVLILWHVSRAALHVDGRITNLIFVAGIPAALFFLQAHRCRYCTSWDTETYWERYRIPRKIRKCLRCGRRETIKFSYLIRAAVTSPRKKGAPI